MSLVWAPCVCCQWVFWTLFSEIRWLTGGVTASSSPPDPNMSSQNQQHLIFGQKLKLLPTFSFVRQRKTPTQTVTTQQRGCVCYRVCVLSFWEQLTHAEPQHTYCVCWRFGVDPLFLQGDASFAKTIDRTKLRQAVVGHRSTVGN